MKIGYCGPFCDTNFGDYAMLINDIYEIDESDVVLFSVSFENIDIILERYLKEYNVKKCKVDVNYESDISDTKSYHVVYQKAIETPLEILQYITNYSDVKECVSGIETLVVTGGGYINKIWTAEHRKRRLYSILAVILIAGRMNKKIVFMSNTIGPFQDSLDFYELLFGELQSVTWGIRDSILSAKNLKKIGIEDNIVDVPDDLYFLNSKFEKKTYDEQLFHLVGKNDYLLLELYESVEFIEKEAQLLEEFSYKMDKIYHMKILFVAFDNKYGGKIQGTVMKKLVPSILSWNEEEMSFLPVEELEFLVDHAKFIVCQRYHLMVRALANNVPFMHVLKNVAGNKQYYYVKTLGIMKKIMAGIEYEDVFFIATSFESALKLLIVKIQEIICFQKDKFARKVKKENESRQLEIRKQFIENYVKR